VLVPCMRTLTIQRCGRDRRPYEDFPIRLDNDMQKSTSVACLAMADEIHGGRSWYSNGRLGGRLGIDVVKDNTAIGGTLEFLCDDTYR
jgi:hypothetical protein